MRIDVDHKQRSWNKMSVIYFSQNHVMFEEISDKIAQWYALRNTILIAFNFSNAEKMICALMFIIINHHGIKCLSNLLQLKPCNVMLKVISDIMAHWWHVMRNTISVAVNFFNVKKMICALMFIIS